MRIESGLSDEAVLIELGRRIARARLERNIAQAELAAEAGIGMATLQRLEAGEAVALTSLIRVLRALGLLEGLERAVPEPLPSPLEQLALRGRRRRRAGHPRGAGGEGVSEEGWRWGDEGPDVA